MTWFYYLLMITRMATGEPGDRATGGTVDRATGERGSRATGGFELGDSHPDPRLPGCPDARFPGTWTNLEKPINTCATV